MRHNPLWVKEDGGWIDANLPNVEIIDCEEGEYGQDVLTFQVTDKDGTVRGPFKSNSYRGSMPG